MVDEIDGELPVIEDLGFHEFQPNIVEYKMLTDTSVEAFETQINQYAGDGYQMVRMFVTGIPGDVRPIRFTAAMVRPKKLDDVPTGNTGGDDEGTQE